MSAESARRPIRRALISVYDKTGLPGLVTALHEAGVEIVSTGSTAARIDVGASGSSVSRWPSQRTLAPRRR